MRTISFFIGISVGVLFTIGFISLLVVSKIVSKVFN